MGQYALTTIDGETVTLRTKKYLDHCERIFRVLDGEGSIVVVQGENQPPSSNSALTHTKHGPVDLWVSSGQYWKLEKAHRCGGGWGWWRRPTDSWNDHYHGGALGTKGLHPQAVGQVQDYHAGLNGMASHSPDYKTAWRPNVIVLFHYNLGVVDLSNLIIEAKKTKGHKSLTSVKLHQRALNIKTGADLKIDGIYGPVTRRFTKRWELQNGWEQDGIPELRSETILQGALANVNV